MCKPIFEDVPRKPHIWMTDTVRSIARRIKPLFKKHSYGNVVHREGDLTLRSDGGVWSVWVGAKLERTYEVKR